MNENIDYDSKERPTTPLHPKANEEFKTVPSVSKLKDLELDLNPDLSDDDDNDDNDDNGNKAHNNTEGSNISNNNNNAKDSNVTDIDKMKEVEELDHKKPKGQDQPQISPSAEAQQSDTGNSNSNRRGKKTHPLSIDESINTSEEVFNNNGNDDDEQLLLNRQSNYKDQLDNQKGSIKTENKKNSISGNGNDEANVDIDDDDVDEEMFESDSSINDGDVENNDGDDANGHKDKNNGGFVKESNDDDNDDDFEDVINAGKLSENYTQASNKANEHKRKLFEIYNNDSNIDTNSNGETIPESDMEEHWSDFNGSPLIAVDSSDDGTGRKSAAKQDLRIASISNNRKKKLSSSQNSKLIAYIDGELLSIQRKFVQSFNAPPTEFDNENVDGQRQEIDVTKFGYQKLTSLLDDLNKIVDFIWYTVKITQGQPKFAISNPSITSRTNTAATQTDSNSDYNYNNNIDAAAAAPATIVTQPPTLKSFYQGQYLIRIAGDLVDYIQKYKIGKPELRQLILFIQKLDQLFVMIIDDLNGFDSTEKVRLASIAERTRIGVINITIRNRINDYKYEIGKLYEELFDRIS